MSCFVNIKSFCLFVCLIGLVYCNSQNSWEELTSKGDSLQLKFKFEDALEYRKKAVLEAQQFQRDTLAFLKLLESMSLNELNIKDKEKRSQAYKNLKNQILQLEKLGAKPERLYQAYRRLYIFSHNYMRNMSDTDKFVTKSVDYHFKSKAIDSATMIKTLHSSGVISREVGRLNASVETFKRAEEFYNHLKVKDTNMLGSIYLDLSMVYDYKFLNIPSKRLTYLKKAEEIFTSVNEPNMDYLVGVFMSLSEVEKSKGNFDKAIGYVNKGIMLHNTNKDEAQKFRMDDIGLKRQLQFHSFLVEIYFKKQDEEKMLHHFKEMQSIGANNTLDDIESDFLSSAYMLVSKFYRYSDNNKAADYLNKGLSIHKATHFENYQYEFIVENVKIEIDEENYSEAQRLLKHLESFDNIPDFIKKDILVLKASLYAKLNDEDQTLKYTNDLLKFLSDDNSNFNDLSTKTFKPSLLLNDANRLLSIVEAVEKSDFVTQEMVHKLHTLALIQFQSNFDQEFLNNELNKTYEAICSYFYESGSKGTLSNVEKSRFLKFTETVESKFLRNTFLENRLNSNNNAISNLVNTEQLIRSNITYLKKHYLEKKTDSLSQLIFEEELKLQDIRDELKGKSLNSIVNTNEIDTEKFLDDFKDAYVIKYKVIGDVLYVVTAHNGTIEFSKKKNYNAIKSEIETVLSYLKDVTVSVPTLKTKLSDLYNKLLYDEDIKPGLPLYIVPDGILHYLPFELLVKDNNYLLSDYDISYASVLSFLRSPVDSNNSVKIALFAPSYSLYRPNEEQLAVRGEPYYLEATEKEVEEISKLFDNSEIFLHQEATKEKFQSLSNEFTVLHLAMHSFLNDADPELSSLVFTDKSQNHQLYISELYGLNLNADLAVLSACNTGVGELKTGKGIVSMNTAFTAAGVPSTLSSLWSAPDKSTKQIMTLFYKNLKEGKSKSSALRQAKLSYLNRTDDPVLQHPFYWAGFVLSGDASSIIEDKSSSGLWIVAGCFAVLALGGFVYAKQSKTKDAA